MTTEALFTRWLARTEQQLETALPDPDTTPYGLHRAMRYAALGGGKRMRPLLVYAAGQLFDADEALLDAPAAAVELIHAYSLVHDDLPCMDDDDVRHGKPSVHKAFGESTAVLAGDDTGSTGVRIVGTETRMFPDAKHLMGWDFTSDGMRLVLARDIPEVVRDRIAPVVSEFVERLGCAVNALDHHVLHPGGPRVMATYRSSFNLPDEALHIARSCMREYGNLSSAAVLFMLSDLMASGRPKPGDRGLMLALGPGFGAEMLVLAW